MKFVPPASGGLVISRWPMDHYDDCNRAMGCLMENYVALHGLTGMLLNPIPESVDFSLDGFYKCWYATPYYPELLPGDITVYNKAPLFGFQSACALKKAKFAHRIGLALMQLADSVSHDTCKHPEINGAERHSTSESMIEKLSSLSAWACDVIDTSITRLDYMPVLETHKDGDPERSKERSIVFTVWEDINFSCGSFLEGLSDEDLSYHEELFLRGVLLSHQGMILRNLWWVYFHENFVESLA